MSRRKKKRKVGLPPESLVYTGDVIVENPDVTIIQYNSTTLRESLMNGYNCLPPVEGMVTWYDVRGLNDTSLIERIGQAFDIHPLALEDILNTTQRPKWEEYLNTIFVIVRALRYDLEQNDIVHEQIAFIFKKNVVLTFQEDTDDVFRNIRERLVKSQGIVRHKGPDYLMYLLLDWIVDQYFVILDTVEEQLDKLEAQILTAYTPSVRNRIYHYKRLLAEIRRVVFPLREVVVHFSREETRLIEASDNYYFRDLNDHIAGIIEMFENQRDTLNNLNELYNAEQNQRATHVMKVLTILSAIFIPLTFIVGVYGTNFDVLPELHHPNGYYIMWAVMIAIAVIQLLYFRWKKWL